MKNWWFSILLAVVYVGIFRFWVWFPESPQVYKVSGVLVCAPLLVTLWYAGLKGYFRGVTDFAAHALVILDIFLEAMISVHQDWRAGIWCAVAFALVIGPYHAMRLRRDDVNRGLIEGYFANQAR